MGFLTPAPPPFDIERWKSEPHLQRLRPLAQDWALNGFGTPYAVYLLYIVKCAIFVVGGFALISRTPGLGSLAHISDWWTEPIVFQKVIVWALLWEILGFGAGSMPLTFRFAPPVGGFLYWLRPATIRLPPWPRKMPFTRGSSRSLLDVALYAAVLGAAVYLLLSDGARSSELAGGQPAFGAGVTRLPTTGLLALLVCLGLLGLRDKVPFLAARSEHYGILLVVFLFPTHELIVASQFVFLAIWWGAASSKLGRHFPHVVAVMTSNTPWNRSRRMKSRLYRDYPEDLRPSALAAAMAHGGTAVEFTGPLVLIAARGGTLGTIAVIVMVAFHLHIISTFPLAVPLEWNLVMIFAVLFLFGHYGSVPLHTLDSPLLIAVMAVALVGVPVLGNLRPDLVSFLPSMRYYAGNWATSQWLFRRDGAEGRFDTRVVKVAPIVVAQLTKLYGSDLAEVLLAKGLAFRAMHTHGRAIAGLLVRAVEDPEDYDIREGELVAGVALGYNFGDGHFHDEGLLAAVQERCRFAPGQLRVIMLESEPAGRGTQRYRIHDAAIGLIESGSVKVSDMVERQPWLDASGTIPVQIDSRSSVTRVPVAPPA